MERLITELTKDANFKDFIHPDNYVLDEKLKIYEDETHEFKMISIQSKIDIPEKIKMLTKYICAFLNTNSGVIYIGVNDDGVVKGLKIDTKLQKIFEKEIENVINKFEKHVISNKLVNFHFNQVFLEDFHGNRKLITDTYVLEIFVKMGRKNMIYTTPVRDSITNDFECYIKLNGTLKKLEGKILFKYAKMKINRYCREMKMNINEKKEKDYSKSKGDKDNHGFTLNVKKRDIQENEGNKENFLNDAINDIDEEDNHIEEIETIKNDNDNWNENYKQDENVFLDYEDDRDL